MFVFVYGLGALFVGLLYITYYVALGMLALMAWGAMALIWLMAKGVELALDRRMAAPRTDSLLRRLGEARARREGELCPWIIGQRVWLREPYAQLPAGCEGRIRRMAGSSVEVKFAGAAVTVPHTMLLAEPREPLPARAWPMLPTREQNRLANRWREVPDGEVPPWRQRDRERLPSRHGER